MAALALSPPRSSRPPPRPRRNAPISEAATEPASKKRKYGGESTPAQARVLFGNHKEEEVDGEVELDLLALVESREKSVPADLVNEVQLGEDVEEAETPAVVRPAPQPRRRRERSERRSRRRPAAQRPRYSNAAAAAAASQASDGYKPREERSWEDFHPDLDLDANLPILAADDVDGKNVGKSIKPASLGRRSVSRGAESKPLVNEDIEMKDAESAPEATELLTTPMKRKPGRPPRRPESMLSGLGSPPAPRIMPLPTHNPKERLNLPKPSFRHFNHFLQYEEDQKENKVNYVDRGMANVGYQESDRFGLPSKVLVRMTETVHMDDEAEVALTLESDGPAEVAQGVQVVGRVEYDMDEQDVAWLDDLNEQRTEEGIEVIKPAIFEITMTQIEKEYHALEKRIPKPQPRHPQTQRPRSSSQAAVNGDPNPPGDEPDSKCSICDDGDCENANAIIFCDGCDLAVHQECYGVPFIPEGQWFCRKCKEIGRGTPTCIFCPNVDGAFKQTSTLRWSHLLCAIWIPEVTIANMTFMEPIADVDKVPKGRWKLNCYICNQKMGACIQCGNKNCYQAFHVTCARKAKLFLKMKTQHQQGIDTTALKAFCDKHVPPDWRRIHDTDHAIIEAKRWYRHAMKDRRWADSQTAALELGAPRPPDGGLNGDVLAEDTIAVTKRRRTQPAKLSWRLPSGAPVVPAVVFNTVEASLARFTIRKRKEFVEKACRYWTLKREARRGAALLKRLQLQLESFSSMEITRRNFAGMGAAGRPRLQRRIEFAEILQKDMAHLTGLCSQVREREELRLKELEVLRELVDTVYFPIHALLVPILRRARKLDEKTRRFKADFDEIDRQLHDRFYTSVSDFSRALTMAIARGVTQDEAALGSEGDLGTVHSQLHDTKPSSAEHQALTQDQKDVKKLAKRILKAVKEPLEDALTREAELCGQQVEDEIRKLDALGIFAPFKSLETEGDLDDSPVKNAVRHLRSGSNVSITAGASPADDQDGDVEMQDEQTDPALTRLNLSNHKDILLPPNEPLTPPTSTSSNSLNPATTTAIANAADVFSQGGVPWYLVPFSPRGTTVHDERYMGREVLREMSEELSDMDEDTLTGLAGSAVGESTLLEGKGPEVRVGEGDAEAGAKEKLGKGKKKKGRGMRWSRPRVR